MIKKIIFKYKILAFIVSKLLCVVYCRKKSEIKSRGQLDLFDYMNIAIALPKVFIEIIPDNNYFGIAYSLKKFASIKNVSSYIEHGYFVGSYVPKVEEYTFAKSIITFSKHRKKYIEEAGIKKVVVPIGPYIYYADDYLSDEEFSQKKKMLGKTLLFFPIHSGTGIEFNYSVDYICDRLSPYRKDYNSFVVCLFWADIQRPEIVNLYLNKGFKIFSAGHRYDYNFLSRLKSMIKLSDLVVTNGMGTHIGYAVFLEKPVWMIRQNIQSTIKTKTGLKNQTIRNNEELQIAEREIAMIFNAFLSYSSKLTTSQKKIVGDMFGFSDIKTKIELANILS
ncbi:hypothetical protein [uncultured Bacteroides sp.]|uniref:hypothetical protein n=1 Tax=uncultured Bacteroides sp. TaxID=162156 RepID=UPI00259599F8|nr:hypothetical protein [uncultured Bacteroides sp.]